MTHDDWFRFPHSAVLHLTEDGWVERPEREIHHDPPCDLCRAKLCLVRLPDDTWLCEDCLRTFTRTDAGDSG